MKFYLVIIGTEILNGRREDKHFTFVRDELAKYGHELFASFVIKDDKELIENTYTLIKNDKDAVMFSFGGIGSTPDDLTREIAAKVFRGLPLVVHKKFKQDIIEKFQEAAYPHRIHMAELPQDAELLFNPVNNMSGFSLDKKYFFVPGFPSMAHPMIKDVLRKHFSHAEKRYRLTLLADTSEESLITLMQQLPTEIELSSLPMFVEGRPKVELSLSATDKEALEHYFSLFKKELQKRNINYELN